MATRGANKQPTTPSGKKRLPTSDVYVAGPTGGRKTSTPSAETIATATTAGQNSNQESIVPPPASSPALSVVDDIRDLREQTKSIATSNDELRETLRQQQAESAATFRRIEASLAQLTSAAILRSRSSSRSSSRSPRRTPPATPKAPAPAENAAGGEQQATAQPAIPETHTGEPTPVLPKQTAPLQPSAPATKSNDPTLNGNPKPVGPPHQSTQPGPRPAPVNAAVAGRRHADPPLQQAQQPGQQDGTRSERPTGLPHIFDEYFNPPHAGRRQHHQENDEYVGDGPPRQPPPPPREWPQPPRHERRADPRRPRSPLRAANTFGPRPGYEHQDSRPYYAQWSDQPRPYGDFSHDQFAEDLFRESERILRDNHNRDNPYRRYEVPPHHRFSGNDPPTYRGATDFQFYPDPPRYGSNDRQIEAARSYLYKTSDRPKPYGEAGIDIVSLRRFIVQTLDFLQAFGGPIQPQLAITYVQGLLRGELRTVAYTLRREETSLDALWTLLYSTQPRQAEEFPRLLVQAASAVPYVPSTTTGTALTNLAAYLAAYSELHRLSLPLSEDERRGRSMLVLPRPEELVHPFLEGLKKTCALGSTVINIMAANTSARRTLPDVMTQVRHVGQENPDLLRPLPTYTSTKTKLCYGGHAHEEQGNPSYSGTPEATCLHAFTPKHTHRSGSGGNSRRKPAVLRAGEPPYNPAVRCTNCALLRPSDPRAGIGHETMWCRKITGDYDPRNPTTNALPATPMQIFKALVEAEEFGRMGIEATRKSMTPVSTPAPSSPATPTLHAMDSMESFPGAPPDDDQYNPVDGELSENE